MYDGLEPLVPGQMSITIDVPAYVPSLTHSSMPVDGVDA